MILLRDTLEFLAGVERDRGVLAGYEYAGPHDFVLREGTWFDAPTEPHSFFQGAPRACFGNAISMATVYDMPYVEGYATYRLGPKSVYSAIHHAWNLDADGKVIDVTWGAFMEGRMVATLGVEYCGVVFSPERADDATWNGDASVLDDFNREWPLLREKWHGEDHDFVWEMSPRLDALRAYARGDREAAFREFTSMEETG